MKVSTSNSFRGWLVGSVAMAGVLSACASGVEPGEQEVASASQAIWNGNNDANTQEANVVVSIGSCTGTLISPQVVLTAAHCIYADSPPTVNIGNSSTAFGGMKSYRGVKAVAHPGYQQGVENVDHPASLDVGLVWLERPVLEDVKIHRPSFNPPVDSNIGTIGIAGWSKCGPKTNVYDDARTTRQVVLWRDGVYQTTTGEAPLDLRQELDDYGTTWHRDGTDVGTCSGDSGGPLFIHHEDLTREVFGVSSFLVHYVGAYDIIGAGWADITQDSVRNWIESQILDTNNGNHSADWLALHGKDATTFWHGEVDYTGSCDTARDPDCDHWYSEHDNAPGTYNPEQLDATEPYTPCSQLCNDPTVFNQSSYGTGPVGSTARCYETTAVLSGMTCGNLLDSRVIRVNGVLVDCLSAIQVPARRNGGYCFQVTPGYPEWAFFQTW